MKEIFENFLKLHNVYDIFEYNLRNQNKINIEEYLKIKNKMDYLTIMIEAFMWRETKEKSDFWICINNLWVRAYLKISK